jgi:hypothetical protein
MQQDDGTQQDEQGRDTSASGTVRRRVTRRLLVVVVAVALAVLAVPVLLVLGHLAGARDVPSFPSLADTPDTTLAGTVAYVDGATGCVRVVAASGQPSKEVYCVPPIDPETAKTSGKPIGPQLRWRSGGVLEVTMFRMTDPPGPGVRAGWQKLVDVRTGAVTDVPDAQAPSTVDLGAQSVVRADGARLTTTSDSSSGHITITLTEASGGTRTLLDVRGPGEYTYGLEAAFWSPDGTWVVADDGRILVIVPSDPPVVRLLLGPRATLGSDPSFARIAVTSETLLR